jgi:hypothetical protein
VNKLNDGEAAIPRCVPWNDFDHNAIMVLRQTGEIIGYLNSNLATYLAPKFDVSGQDVPGVVARILRGRYMLVIIEFTVPRGGVVSQ